jgi:hypothetical protein
MADITGHPQGRCKQKLEAKHDLGVILVLQSRPLGVPVEITT